jgi:hypothetical protein
MFEEDGVIAEFKTLDPSTVKDAEGLKAFVGKAVATVKALDDNQAAQDRAIADLSLKMQQAVENSQPRATVTVDGRDADLSRRYCDEGGTLHLRSSKRTVAFGGKSIVIEQPGLLDDAQGVSPWQAEFRRSVEDLSWSRMLLGKSSDRALADLVSVCRTAPPQVREQVEATVSKALTDTAGAGAEWIQDGYFSSLYEEMKLPNRIAGLFPVVNMTNATMKQPKLITGARPYVRNRIASDDSANYTASTPVTSDETITVADMVVRVAIDEMDAEDMAFAYQPILQRVVADAVNDGYEDAILNGDSNATHQDAIASWNIRSRWGASGLGGSADHRRLFLGLRALAADRSMTTDMGSLQTVAGIGGTIIGGLGERATSDVVIIVSPEVLFKKLLTDSNLLTLDKLGASATILSGQVGQLFSHPVVMSRYLSADLAATGLFTGSGALSGVLGVDRMAFSHYQRRGLLIEMKREILNGSIYIVATLRRVFKTVSGSTEPVVHFGYNWLS